MLPQQVVKLVALGDHELNVLNGLILHVQVDHSNFILEIIACNVQSILQQHLYLHQIVLQLVHCVEKTLLDIIEKAALLLLVVQVSQLMLLQALKLFY